jgi:hypothetical protein
MIERGSTTADEMVLAFLQAEVDSPRYRDYYALALTKIGATRATLIDNADLQDARQSSLVRFGAMAKIEYCLPDSQSIRAGARSV